METEKYQRGKIYTIRHPDSEKYYIGSTCEKYISNRFGGHKRNYKSYLKGGYGNSSSFKLFDLGIDQCYIELLELYPCNSKLELERREGELIRLHKNDVVNKIVPCRTKKEHYYDNKEVISEKKKEYYQDNKEQLLEQMKQYRQDNKEQLLEKAKKYQKDNRDKIAEKKKQYRQANREQINEQRRINYTCECGTESTKSHKARHERSIKHIEYINSK